MARILKYDDINLEQLNELFDKRGHSFGWPNFLDNIKHVLEEKLPYEVYQCQCGELFYISGGSAFEKNSFNIDGEVLCKRCSGLNYSDGYIDYGKIRRLELIGQYLEQTYIDKKNSVSIPQLVLNSIQEISQCLIASNNIDEIIYSYKWTTDFILREIDSIETNDIFDEFTKIINRINRQAQMNDPLFLNKILKRRDIIAHIKQKNVFISQLRDPAENINNDPFNIHSIDLNTQIKKDIENKLRHYLLLIEQPFYIDYLASAEILIKGGQYFAHPFKIIRNKNGKKITSLGNQIEYLKNVYDKIGLGLIFENTFNTHLRNAIAHNEFNIVVEARNIELIHYSESIGFQDLENLINQLRQLEFVIDYYIIDSWMEEIKPNMRNCGIYKVQFLYEQHDSLLLPAISMLRCYQYWNFVFDKGNIPPPSFRIDRELSAVRIRFPNNESDFIYPITQDIYNWLKNFVEYDMLYVELYSLTPYIKFKEELENNIQILDGYEVYTDHISKRIIPIHFDESKKLMKDLLRIEPDTSPLINTNLTSIELPYDEEWIKEETKRMIHMHGSLTEDDLKDSIPSLLTENEVPTISDLELPRKADVLQSKVTPMKLVQESYYKVLECDDEDITLLDIKRNSLVIVESGKIAITLSKDQIIWAKLFSFPHNHISLLWFFSELKIMT